MELETILQHLGLNEKQAKVYLALLQMGKGSVPAISIKAGTKRPTTYLLLEELRMQGLVMLLPKKGKVLYSANSPHELWEKQREKEQMIRQNMPELMAMFNTQKEKPKVTYYQGERNVVDLYNKEIFVQPELDIFGSIEALGGIYEKIEYNLKKAEEQKTKIRELLQSDEKSIEYSKKHFSEFHQVKLASKELKFPTDNIIFGNKLAIFSYKDEPMAVVIESSDVVATYKSMFELVWNSLPEIKIK
ncbi:MAG TPA: helix-turn-helix domain-containing protein [Candidatus Moranbacteria bacterium]|nr:helix-turn-helix domain-containing protein [Candidatus Moranbacteria bacterium]